jgi:L,D-transpeptidase YcbB
MGRQWVSIGWFLAAVTLTSTPAAHVTSALEARAGQPEAAADVAATVDRVLAAAVHPRLTWSRIPDVAGTLLPLYAADADRLLWFEGGRPLPSVAPAVQAIGAVGGHGLVPGDYDAELLAELWQHATTRGFEDERAHFDLALSIAALRVMRAVHLGRVDPSTMHWDYAVAAKPFDAATHLRAARVGPGLAATLEALSPPITHYARARRLLAAYRALDTQAEAPTVPALPAGRASLDPGTAWTGVAALGARLRRLGDLPPGAAVPATYSGVLVDAVKRFQDRHGLAADGVVGPATLEALNVPVKRRLRQIELAMERMRWLPDLSARPNVFVNVPLFKLWATDPTSGAEALRMRVIVGKSLNHQTPLFLEEMEYVVFRPYWNPPHGITAHEIVPHARRDPAYLDREAFEIVASGADNAPALAATPENLSAVVAGRLHLRQRPGPHNALGLAKFIFPNAENVYMHSTPAQQLFSQTRRDFSHGCIRLEDPAQFAAWVLRDQPSWTRARIDSAMQASRPTQVNLTSRLRVVLFYDTVHVDSEGVAHFVEDIYGHDRGLDAALMRGYPFPVKG